MSTGLDNLEDHVREALLDFSRSNGFDKKDVRFKVEPGSERNCNFHGDIYRAAIEDKKKSMSVILKVAISNIRYTNSSLLFGNEINFYKKVHPIVKKYYEETIGGDFVTVPTYYWHSEAADKEVIILEDMCSRGFKVANASKGITQEEASLVITQLAKYQAACEGLRIHRREVFDDISGNVREAYLPELDETSEAVITAYSSTTEALTRELANEKLPEEQANIVLAYLDDFLKLFRDSFVRDPDLPLTVVTFGDCWISNILFKYQNGKPVDACFLDFQMTRVTSPILDVLDMLLMSLRGDDLTQGLTEMLSHYQSELSDNLGRLGVALDDKLFREHLVKYSRYAFTKVLFLFPRMFSPSDGDKETSSSAASAPVDLRSLFKVPLTQECIINAVSAALKQGLLKP